ncbi:argonaute-like protein [Auriscalpium vulgare]|uniref:Argonaute-like protein n=1 Tax=Auriscalpium vulgare TaxID=40419 RepID=A0ACB8S2R4_9AGAM|nr:argonaute-like protein [Auriscalpium vulgare]
MQRGGRGDSRGRGGDRGRGGRGSSPAGRGSPGGDSYRGRGSPGPGGGDGYRGRGGGGDGGFRGGGGDFRGRGFGGPPRGRGGREQGGVFAPGGPANIDARLDASQDQLVASFKSLTLQHDDLPLRPNFGTVGTAIKLRTNFFPVRLPKGPLHEYDVSISPAQGTKIRRVKRRIFQLAEQAPDWVEKGLRGNVAHDHSAKLIAAKVLVQPLTIRVPFYDEDEDGPRTDGKGKEYTLTIKYIQAIDTGNLQNYLMGDLQSRNIDILPVIAALNLILAAHPNRTQAGGGVMVGRNRFFFPTVQPPVPLGGGLEAWRGFFSSVRPAFKQLMVNVNVCTTAFYQEGNLAESMMAFERSSFGARASAFVRGVRVKTDHLGFRKSVKGLAKVNARQHKFKWDEGGGAMVSVEDYFLRKYRIKLRYPEMQLVDVGGKQTNYIPPEVCTILPGQSFKGKLLDDQTAQMILVAAKPPNVNAAAITTSGLKELGFNQGTNASPVLNVFGVTIGNEMAIVPGRILSPPRIRYGRGDPQVDERASWNMRGVVFAVGAKLDNWAVLVIKDGMPNAEFVDTHDPELLGTVEGFVKMCRTSGMNVSQAPPQYVMAVLPRKAPQDPIRAQAIGVLRNTLMTVRPKPSLVLVILANGDKHVYSGLKHLCDVYLDVATVCVQSQKIRKQAGQLQYFANVALKVNMKLGGVNHGLDEQSMAKLKQPSTMLVGMDVTHPGPGTVKGTPSIAAVVASSDQKFAQYPASMRIQETKKEMITDLREMMEERLQVYRDKNNKTLPARILVYRDGVSEGQFPIVVADEIPKIKAAFRKYDTAQTPYRPKLTVVICGKRHHTRFYPTDAQHADRDGNPRPGTVVDRGVTAIYEFDFFLQAHGGLQGTTKPTHYYVVCNEMDLKADDLQGLTNAVSYTFARATKAVSLVSPAYYADLACERGRCYLHKLLQGLSSSSTTTASGSAAEEDVYKEAVGLWHNGVKGKLKDVMFYL